MRRRTPPKGPVRIADCPVAHLAEVLQAQYSAPAHLDPEELAAAFCRHFELTPPVSLSAGLDILAQLGIEVNPPGYSTEFPAGESGLNLGDLEEGKWIVLLDTRRSLRRQVQTVFHELYEILRDYLHQWGGEFPKGWSKEKYPPERYARWFAGAVTLPRRYVLDFLENNGLDPELLREATETSRALVIRRLRELLPDTPLVAVQCAVPEKLMRSTPPACRCIDSVRSPEFSVALNSRNARKYHIPRKREVWAAGPIVSMVVDTGRTVLVNRVTGFDLFGYRDVSAIALPVLDKGGVESIVIYAVHPERRHLFDGIAERLNPVRIPETVHLLGNLLARAEPKRKPRKPQKGDRPVQRKVGSGEVKTFIWEEPVRRRQPRLIPPTQTAMVSTRHVAVNTNKRGQQEWDLDPLDPIDELVAPTSAPPRQKTHKQPRSPRSRRGKSLTEENAHEKATDG